jgi:hypothetical protein
LDIGGRLQALKKRRHDLAGHCVFWSPRGSARLAKKHNRGRLLPTKVKP